METTLSDLPEDIIHRIFSLADEEYRYLTNKEALQLGLKLSKYLLTVLKRRPKLVFNSGELNHAQAKRRFSDPEYAKRYIDELNHIIFTMNREDIQLDTFILVGVIMLPYHHSLYDRCINLAVKKGVRKLYITMFEDYDLPQPVFEFKSLVELKLGNGCHLKPEGRVVWPNLKQLILTSMYAVKGKDLETIIRGCPSIEYLEVSSNSVIGKYFKVVSNNLKQLRFYLVDNQRLNVSATPNLKSIYCASSRRGHPQIVDFGDTEYPNLKSVEVRNEIIDTLFSTNFASRFPILENLIIAGGKLSNTIDIWSMSLKKIELKYTHVLEEVCFDVPNLVHFKYEHTILITYRNQLRPKLIFTGNSDGWSSDIMLYEHKSKIDAPWFLELNKFLDGLNGSETSITVEFYDSKLKASFDEAHPMIENSAFSIPCVRDFNLRMSNGNIRWSSVTLSAILDGILAVCKPGMISVNFPAEFVKLMYEKLSSKSGHDLFSVTDIQMSCGRDSEHPTLSDRFKDLNTFFEEFAKRKSLEPTSFHLEYCSGNCPKC